MSASPQSAPSPTIVVVDDDAAVLNALGFALEAEGFRVRRFRSAGDLFAAREIEDAACLVIDQGLPDESGLDVLARLRGRGIETPAVLITTNPPRALHLQASGLDTPVVEKPLLGDQLFGVIRGLIKPNGSMNAIEG